MTIFTESHRAYLQEMRALAADRSGNEHLVGLTLDETAFYVKHAQMSMSGQPTSRDDRARYLALNERHERARLAVLGAEVQVSVDKPSVQ